MVMHVKSGGRGNKDGSVYINVSMSTAAKKRGYVDGKSIHRCQPS
jgi:hypothetical protein